MVAHYRDVIYKILGIVVLVLLLGYLALCWYVAAQVLKPYPSTVDIPATSIATNYQDISVTTSDHVTLKGWLFPGTTNKLIILVAGFGNNRLNKDYHSVDLSKELLTKGYGVLMYDARGYGESTPTHLTYGDKESQDLLDIIDFAKSKGYQEKNIAIISDSFGAIATLMVIDKLSGIGAIVADSPAAHAKAVIENVMQNEHHLPPFIFPTVFFFTKYVYGVDFDKINPVDVVKRTDKPFMILWADQDKTITKDQIDEVVAAAPQASLVIFPGGVHVDTYKHDPELYRQKVFGYIDQNLQ